MLVRPLPSAISNLPQRGLDWKCFWSRFGRPNQGFSRPNQKQNVSEAGSVARTRGSVDRTRPRKLPGSVSVARPLGPVDRPAPLNLSNYFVLIFQPYRFKVIRFVVIFYYLPWWLLFRDFCGYSFLMDLVSISLELIHVFGCEFLMIDCFYNHFCALSL